jgi:hypothetical protein
VILKPHTLTFAIAIFIDGDASMNNSRGRKLMYSSAGLEPPVYLMDEIKFYFETFQWPWTKLIYHIHVFQTTIAFNPGHLL